MKTRTTALLAGTCLLAMASPAWAQSTTGGTDPQQSVANAKPLDASIAQGDPANQGDAAAPPQDIVVTGTLIRRPNATAAAPIQSVTASEIRTQAAVNVEDVLNRLPQIAPDSQQNYPNSDGRQRIKLRSLGFERTLTLIDGKRLGTSNGEDANIIPTTLIDRVDVLTGGASAVYGSDAIAGVVNFVMKRDFEGIQIDTNYNFYDHVNRANVATATAQRYGFNSPTDTSIDGARSDISLTAGKKLFGDALSVEGFVDYRHADPVYMRDRSTSACALQSTNLGNGLSCQLNTSTANGTIIPQAGANPGTSFVNNPNGTNTFVPYSSAPGVATNYNEGYALQRQDNRINAGGFVTLHLSDAAEVYANGLWFRDSSYSPYFTASSSYTRFGSTPYQVNCNNPFLSAQQGQAICGAAAGTSALAPIDLLYRFDGALDLEDHYINSGTRISGGVRGNFAKAWHYDIGGVYAGSHQDTEYANYTAPTQINNALQVVNVNGTPTCLSAINGTDRGCVPFNAFQAGALNPAALNYLFSGSSGVSTVNTQLYDVVGTIQGDLGQYGITSPWAEQGVAIAIGGEYREDHFQGFANSTYRLVYGGSDQTLQQNAKEGYVEVQVPIAQHRAFADQLQFNGAYRASKYSGNDSTFSTYKLEAIWAPVRDITFRGSFNRAQRAPTVIEQYQALNTNYGVQGGSQNDFCASTADPNNPGQYIGPKASASACAATGLPSNLYGSRSLSCPNNQCTVRYGGFTVNPETAYTKTFGVILKPRFLPGLTLSVDRFIIDLSDSIGYNDDTYFYNGCELTGDPFYCSKFVRNADGTLYSPAASNPATGYIRAGTTNYYKSKSHGWDFQGQYDLRLGKVGSLNFLFDGSLATLIGGQDATILPAYNCADGYYGGPCNQIIPKWSHNLRSTYATQNERFTASLDWRYTGSLTNISNSGMTALGYSTANQRTDYYRISPQSYFDLSISFAFGKQFVLRAAANNILDQAAPIVPDSYNYGLSRSNTLPQRYDSLGRQIAIGTSIRF